MSVSYRAVQWNRQKRIYDLVLVGGIALFLIVFVALTKALHPNITDEIMLIRAFGTAGMVLLHIVLCIGPLCRLNPKFLPLLYNRRHMGVTMFVLSLAHGVLAILTYHVGGDANPIVNVFTSSSFTDGLANLPFQPFGFIALIILFLMAATSHDFWLANLSAPVWKALHMLVYIAYTLLVAHVAFGVLHSEISPVYVILTGLGMVTVVGLHLMAAFREIPADQPLDATDDFVDVCAVDDIEENRAKIVHLSGERVAVFKYDGKVSAVSNVCQHQNGPLGEGRIVDGCITCPWHGYQYHPDSGASPPPFTETIPTFNVSVENGRVLVDPKPNAAGTKTEPANCRPTLKDE